MKKVGKAICFSLMFSLVFFLNLEIPVENINFINRNVEALAGIESNFGYCFEVGSLDCPISSEKVKWVR